MKKTIFLLVALLAIGVAFASLPPKDCSDLKYVESCTVGLNALGVNPSECNQYYADSYHPSTGHYQGLHSCMSFSHPAWTCTKNSSDWGCANFTVDCRDRLDINDCNLLETNESCSEYKEDDNHLCIWEWDEEECSAVEFMSCDPELGLEEEIPEFSPVVAVIILAAVAGFLVFKRK